jgi:hypothetical protein
VQKGKYLEKKLKEYCKKKGVYCLRLYDTHSAGQYIPALPADFLLLHPEPMFVECKETESTLLPISSFRPAQLKAMRDMQRLRVYYHVLVSYKKKSFYVLDSGKILDAIKDGRKSIDFIKEGIETHFDL